MPGSKIDAEAMRPGLEAAVREFIRDPKAIDIILLLLPTIHLRHPGAFRKLADAVVTVNDKAERAEILDGRKTGVTRMNFMSQGGDSAAAVCNMNPFSPFGRLCPDTFTYVPNALSNIQYGLFRRQRLGLTIAPCPQDVHPHHYVCRKCGKQLDNYATHADSCKFTNGGRITRHSAVRTVLYKALWTIPEGFAMSEPPVRSLGFVHDKTARTGAAKYNVVTSADVSLNVASSCAGPAPSSTIVVDARIVFPSSKSTEKERGTVQRANGVITAGAGSKPDHGIDAAVADKFTHYAPYNIPTDKFVPFVMSTFGAFHILALSFLQRIARMQVNNTVRESVEPQQVTGGRARIPYAARLRTLIDSVAIALVRAQMDLIDTYVIVCAQGHVRPQFARGQRVRRPPAAGLHAGSSTVSTQGTGLQ